MAGCQPATNPNSTTTIQHADQASARLVIAQLAAMADRYLQLGVAPSTLRAYQSDQTQFVKFCLSINQPSLPASENSLVLLVADVSQKVCHATIRLYLSGIRYFHITHGHGDPLIGKLRLDLVLKGVRKDLAKQARTRLPITSLILRAICTALEATPLTFNNRMLWAACYLVCLFLFLRSREFTIPSQQAFDPTMHLTTSDITIDSHTDPSLVRVHLKASKTDQFKQGMGVFLGKTDKDLCPLAALLNYLAARPPITGPLLVTSDGKPLTKPMLVKLLKATLESAGYQPQALIMVMHSFLIGAATTAAANEVPETLIKTLGRWSSNAFQTYSKIPKETLAQLSASLM